MRKKAGLIFIIICMAVCLIPFAGMTFFRTDTTTENKTLASFPGLTNENGGPNMEFFDGLADYFEDHFAFREYLVNADALIQSRIFKVSNVDTVLVGRNGWLYYTATLDDYLGQNLMSDREIYNAAHNLTLMQEYAESRGAQFAVTIPPNKNTLYGENMPYYDSKVVSADRNAEKLAEAMQEQGVNYVNLFDAFESQDEVLYCMRDSHWNEKGAVLAYNTILDFMDIGHNDLEQAAVNRAKTYIGDLNSMVYPLTSVPEWNYTYSYDETWSYVTDTESVEDGRIQTENPDGEGSLLMFRDSFGNTLLPLMANTFADAFFTKGTPYNLGLYMDTYHPDTVIVEKVERNIADFAEGPPVMSGIDVLLEEQISTADTKTDFELGVSENDPSYLSMHGVLEGINEADLTDVYVRLSSGGTVKTVAAFLVSDGDTDFGYQLYLAKDEIINLFGDDCSGLQLEVITRTGDGLTAVYTGTEDFSGLVFE
ncbi:MAG: hypothetical protein LUC41_01170 [Clostridiales bacterium]|nr:hypothetical protein [Clostridiales bacterium]